MTQPGAFSNRFNIHNISNSGSIKLRHKPCYSYDRVFFYITGDEEPCYDYYKIQRVVRGQIFCVTKEKDSKFNPASSREIAKFVENSAYNSAVIGGIFMKNEMLTRYKPDTHQMMMMTLNVDKLPIYVTYSINSLSKNDIDELDKAKMLLTSSGIPVCDAQEMAGEDNAGPKYSYRAAKSNLIKMCHGSDRSSGGIRTFGSAPDLFTLNTGMAEVCPGTHCVLFDGKSNTPGTYIFDAEDKRNDRGEPADDLLDIDDFENRRGPANDFICTKSFSQLKSSNLIPIKSNSRTVDSEMLDDLEKISDTLEDNSFYFIGQYTDHTGGNLALDTNMVYRTNVNIGVGNLTYAIGRDLGNNGIPVYLLLQLCVDSITDEGVLKLLMSSPMLPGVHTISTSKTISLTKTTVLAIYCDTNNKKITATASALGGGAITTVNDICHVEYLFADTFDGLLVVGLSVHTANFMHQVTYPYNATTWNLAKTLGRKIITEAKNLLVGFYDPGLVGTEISTATTSANFNKVTSNSKNIEAIGKKLCRLEGVNYHVKFLINNRYDFDIVCADIYGTQLFKITSKNNGKITLTQCGKHFENQNLALEQDLKWIRIERRPGVFKIYITGNETQKVINHVDESQELLSHMVKTSTLFKSRELKRLQIKDDVDDDNRGFKIIYPPMSFLDNYANDVHVGSIDVSLRNDNIENVNLYVKFREHIHSSNKEILYGSIIIQDDSGAKDSALLSVGGDRWLMCADFSRSNEATFNLPPEVTTSAHCMFTSLSCEPVIS